MNIIQQQNMLHNVPDALLQRELLQPTGAMPSYLVLTELQRRKDLRGSFAAMQKAPDSTVAEEFAKGMGGADVGNYGNAVRGAVPGGAMGVAGQTMGQLTPMDMAPQQQLGGSSPMGAQPQGFAGGGGVGYMSPYERQLRGLTATPLQTPVPYDYYAPPLRSMIGRAWDQMTTPPTPEEVQRAQNTPAENTVGNFLKQAVTPPQPYGFADNAGAYGGGTDQPQDYGFANNSGPGPEQPAPFNQPAQTAEGGQGYGGPEPVGLGVVATGSGPASAPRTLGAPVPHITGGGGGLAPAGGGNSDLASYMAQVRGAMASGDPYAGIEQGNKEDRDRIAKSLEADKGLALANAGFAMMAGTSPWAAPNIGQGGMAGIKYWSDAEKEMRQASRDIRNADTAIAVARANRDERQLEMGMRIKQHEEEVRQRSLDRANASGIAAAGRAEARALQEMNIKSQMEDRKDRRDQDRITNMYNAYKLADTEANALDVKAAQIQATWNEKMKDVTGNVPAMPADLQAQLNNFKTMADEKRAQADQYREQHGRLATDRLGIPTVNTTEEVNKLEPGTNFRFFNRQTGRYEFAVKQ